MSTLHTNSAVGAVTRLVDMGIEPFLITATLEAVVAQRLVRTICKDCRKTYSPDEDLLRELGADGALLKGSTFYFGEGCPACHHTGYKGRTGIFEIMVINDNLRRTIGAGGNIEEVREAARAAGMRTLRERGIEAGTRGQTTVEEVLRETGI